MMKFNKCEFLKSELGKRLKICIGTLDSVIEKSADLDISDTTFDFYYAERDILSAQWEIYKLFIKEIYGITYYFTRTSEYYGICTVDNTDWLFKIYR